MSHPFVVVGGGVAALVAADHAATLGAQVELHLPERGVGGGFLPLTVGARRLDLGARLVELAYDDEPDEPPPLEAYRPGPHGHRPYLALVDAFVRDLAAGELVDVPAPDASIGGRRVGDYVLSGDLSGVVDSLDVDVRDRILEETDQALREQGPRGLFAADRAADLWASTFTEAGEAQTGATFHGVVLEPLAAKMVPGGGSSVVGALHRKIWLPLFHPLTAWQAARGELEYRPQRPMCTLPGKGMGGLIERLLGRIEDSPLIEVHVSGPLREIIGAQGDEVVLRFDGADRRASRPLVATGAEEAFGAAGASLVLEKAMASLVWLDVDEGDVRDRASVVFSAEPDVGAFRVSRNLADHVRGRATFCCELRHDVTEPDLQAAAARSAVEALGIVRAGASVEVLHAAVVPAFAVPSRANRAAHDEARRVVAGRHLPVRFAAGGVEFGADTFNEQLVQGLAAGSAAAR